MKGDYIPVKVTISHTKFVRSMFGVILTLYRQGRVDTRPILPSEPGEKGKPAKAEEYYPKSVTGLGGLSLSGTGPTHVFRKDLAQSITPLLVDPQTLTAEVNAKVRMPEDAFQTISTVPGGMISFKYHVEVVVDIQGKLQNQDRNLGQLDGQGPQPEFQLNPDGQEGAPLPPAPFGSTILDTASIRRDKGVVTCLFEVIVGRCDSERRKGKGKVIETSVEPMQAQPQAPRAHQHAEQHTGPDLGQPEYPEGYAYGYDWYDEQYASYYSPHSQMYYSPYEETYASPPPLMPIPSLPDETQMTEKERIQQAEARLLPSQPPGIDDGVGDSVDGATAPYLPDETSEDPNARASYTAPESSGEASSSAVQGFTSIASREHLPQLTPADPNRTTIDVPSSSRTALNAGADDQVLQGQLLQAEASAPPAAGDEPDLHAPPAPTLDETEALPHGSHDSHADAAGFSHLPRYE